MPRDEERARRRPWQFSLRWLLLFMLLPATFFLGWKANDWNRDLEIRRAAEEASRAAQSSRMTAVEKMPVDPNWNPSNNPTVYVHVGNGRFEERPNENYRPDSDAKH